MQMRRQRNTIRNKKKENNRENKEEMTKVIGTSVVIAATETKITINMMIEVTEEATGTIASNSNQRFLNKKLKKSKRNYFMVPQGKDQHSSIQKSKLKSSLNKNQRKRQEQSMKHRRQKNNL
jgi:hypothetical protein